jgi:hypothetical protein
LLVPLGLLAIVHAAALQRRNLSFGREHALASAADLRMLRALDAQVPPGCWVLTNYGDAGQWIPALLDRPVTFPQVNVLFFDDASAEVHPCAAFRGERLRYHVDTVAAECARLGCAPAGRDGGAAFLRIDDPGARVAVTGYH